MTWGVDSPETPTYKNLWIKNLLAEICHFTTQKYKNLHVLAKQDQAGSYLWVKVITINQQV